MQHAVTVSPDDTKISQAGPLAPHYAQCVYCGMPVELIITRYRFRTYYYYKHTSDLSATECQKLRDRE